MTLKWNSNMISRYVTFSAFDLTDDSAVVSQFTVLVYVLRHSLDCKLNLNTINTSNISFTYVYNNYTDNLDQITLNSLFNIDVSDENWVRLSWNVMDIKVINSSGATISSYPGDIANFSTGISNLNDLNIKLLPYTLKILPTPLFAPKNSYLINYINVQAYSGCPSPSYSVSFTLIAISGSGVTACNSGISNNNDCCSVRKIITINYLTPNQVGGLDISLGTSSSLIIYSGSSSKVAYIPYSNLPGSANYSGGLILTV